MKRNAKRIGACENLVGSWSDDAALIFTNNVEWCMKNDFPSLNELKQFKDELKSREMYVFDDLEIMLDNNYEEPSNMAFASSAATIHTSGFKVSSIYAYKGSVINLKASGSSVTHISVYDASEINVDTSDDAYVFIHDVSKGRATINKSGLKSKIKTIRK